MRKACRCIVVLVVGAAILGLAACSRKPSAPTAGPNPTTATSGSSTLTLEQLTAIQPGLGTVMIEYASRFANAWFAAQAGNWEMTHYQVLEMTEVQEVGETTRPARAPALKAFEQGFLNPLDEAAKSGDLMAFTTAYDKAIAGCNACHASQTSQDFPGSYKFVKIQRPLGPTLPNVDWKGQ